MSKVDGIKKFFNLFGGSSSKTGAAIKSAAVNASDEAVEAIRKSLTLDKLEDAMWKGAQEVKASSKKWGFAKGNEMRYASGATRGANDAISKVAEDAAKKRLETATFNLGGGKKGRYDDLDDTKQQEALARFKAQETETLKKQLGINDNQIDGLAAQIGDSVKKGSKTVRFTKGVGEFAVKHPIIAAGGGLGLYAGYNALFDSVAKDDAPGLLNTIGDVLDPIGGAASSLGGFGIDTLAKGFNFVTGNLQYMGMDPQWAHAVTALGGLLAMKGVLDFGAEKAANAIGLKQLPFSGLVTLVASTALALNVASAAAENAPYAPVVDNDKVITNHANAATPAPAPTF